MDGVARYGDDEADEGDGDTRDDVVASLFASRKLVKEVCAWPTEGITGDLN